MALNKTERLRKETFRGICKRTHVHSECRRLSFILRIQCSADGAIRILTITHRVDIKSEIHVLHIRSTLVFFTVSSSASLFCSEENDDSSVSYVFIVPERFFIFYRSPQTNIEAGCRPHCTAILHYF